MHPRALRRGLAAAAAVTAGLLVAAGLLTAAPASAAVGDDDPAVGAAAADGLVINEVELACTGAEGLAAGALAALVLLATGAGVLVVRRRRAGAAV